MLHSLDVPVAQHDEGSKPGMHDLDVLYPDRPAAAVEVTAAADGESIALWKLMNGRSERWQVNELAGGWRVSVMPAARAKRLRKELPTLLLRLEQTGIRELHVGEGGAGLVEETAYELGVVKASQGGTEFPGSIYISLDLPPERTGGWVADTGNALAEWLGTFLGEPRQEDVRRKLARSGAAETHAFVLVPALSLAPFTVIDLLIRDDAPLPMIDPRLPIEVTDVWAVSSWSSGVGFRWSQTGGWWRFDKDLAQPDGQAQ